MDHSFQGLLLLGRKRRSRRPAPRVSRCNIPQLRHLRNGAQEHVLTTRNQQYASMTTRRGLPLQAMQPHNIGIIAALWIYETTRMEEEKVRPCLSTCVYPPPSSPNPTPPHYGPKKKLPRKNTNTKYCSGIYTKLRATRFSFRLSGETPFPKHHTGFRTLPQHTPRCTELYKIYFDVFRCPRHDFTVLVFPHLSR